MNGFFYWLSGYHRNAPEILIKLNGYQFKKKIDPELTNPVFMNFFIKILSAASLSTYNSYCG